MKPFHAWGLLFFLSVTLFFALNFLRTTLVDASSTTIYNAAFLAITGLSVASGIMFFRRSKLDFRSRYLTVRTILSHTTYKLIFLIILIMYFAFNFWINQFYTLIQNILHYNLAFVIPFFSLAVFIGIGIALSLTIVIYKFTQIMSFQKEAGMTAVGGFLGLLGGACPGCFVGLLPSLAAVFGLTVTLGTLPFLGFELQVPTFFIVGATLYWVSNPLTCKT